MLISYIHSFFCCIYVYSNMTGVDKIVWIAYWRTRKVQAGKPWSMCWYPTQENTIPTDQRQWGSPVHEQLCEPSSARSVGGKWHDAWNFWCSDFVHSFLPNETCMYGRCASVKYRMSSTKHPMSKSGVHRCANSTLYVVVLQKVACACLCPYHHYPHYKHVKSWQRLLRTADCQELYKGCSMTCRFHDLTSHVVLGK